MAEDLLTALQALIIEVDADAAVVWKEIEAASGGVVVAAAPSEVLAVGSPWPAMDVPTSGPTVEWDKMESQGFDGYITKPIEIGSLRDEMRRCLSDSFSAFDSERQGHAEEP